MPAEARPITRAVRFAVHRTRIGCHRSGPREAGRTGQTPPGTRYEEAAAGAFGFEPAAEEPFEPEEDDSDLPEDDPEDSGEDLREAEGSWDLPEPEDSSDLPEPEDSCDLPESPDLPDCSSEDDDFASARLSVR